MARAQESPAGMFKLAAGVVLGIIALWSIFQIVEVNAPSTILVVQGPISGKLTWYTDAGVKWQGFGKTTRYPKRDIYEFKTPR